MAPVKIDVSPTFTSFTGLAPAALRDTLDEAPDRSLIDHEAGRLRSSTANLLYLLTRYPQAEWNDPLNLLLAARAYAFVGRLNRPQPGDYEHNWPFKVQPYPVQLEIFAAARHMPLFALSPVAMGTGKTKMALDCAADKYMRNEIDGIAIVAPNGVHKQWIEQAIPQHLTDSLQRACAVWKNGRQTPSTVMPGSTPRRAFRALSFNIEGFSRNGSPAFSALRQYLSSGRMLLILDESSRCKNPRAIRTKNILLLARYAKQRCILTGTPVTRGLEDLYTQFNFLDQNIIGFSNYWSFRSHYCILKPIPGAPSTATRIDGYRNVEQFVKKIAPFIFVVPKDVLGLPEKTYERRETVLTKEQVKVYSMLEDELVEDLLARRIQTPANAAVRLIRLQQVLCGRLVTQETFLTDEGDEIETQAHESIPNGRLETLLDVVEEHDGPAVIWCRFVDDIEDIKEMFDEVFAEKGYKSVTYYGKTSEKDRVQAVKDFKEGRARYFIANPATAGTGLDGLQVAELAVYYSNGFNSEQRWQSEDRIHRIGMGGRAHYVDIVAPHTVDGKILDNLAQKQSLAKLVFEDPAALNSDEDQRERRAA